MSTSGLILSPNLAKDFRFVIMDVNCTVGDRVIELDAPEELYDIAALLRDPERYVVESVWSRAIGHFVAGGMRGSHQMPLMPVLQNYGTSYFDGPLLVSCAAFAMHEGVLTERRICYDHPFWNSVRDNVSVKAMEMCRQGFFGAATLPMSELEYTGIRSKLEALDRRFLLRS